MQNIPVFIRNPERARDGACPRRPSHEPTEAEDYPNDLVERVSGQQSHHAEEQGESQQIAAPEDLLMNRELSMTVPHYENNSFRSALLITNEKIDDNRRFRILFVALLVIIAGSTQGVHSVFGTLYMAQVYGYTVKQMVTIYLTGQVFGMFVFPFGALYDWFGPRPVILLCTILIGLGNMLFALMFANHIGHTVTKSAIIYAVMCWGCYGTQVTALPCALTHMPRNRGQPLGFLITFSNLGASLFACFFRGFFSDHIDHLMWFMFAFSVAAGLCGVWYLEDAPYTTTRRQQAHLTMKQKVKQYLVRNRYMSQLIGRRRFILFTLCLIFLNLYLTIQSIVAGYHKNEMTKSQYRGIAIGAIIVVMFTTVLIWPFDFMNGDAIQDKEYIKAVKEKERELKRQRREQILDHSPTRQEQNRDDYTGVQILEVGLDDSANMSHLRSVNPLNQNSGNVLRHDDPVVNPNEATEDVLDRHEVVLREPATHPLVLTSREPSTYAMPYFESINIAHESFTTSLYEVSFWKSLAHLDVWLIFYTTFVIWGIGMAMTGNWNIYIMVLARNAKMDYAMYILFAAMAGISTASGRVFVGSYEVVSSLLHNRYGWKLPATAPYPIACMGFCISMILWGALPGTHVLIIPYMLGPFFYGMSHSMTLYILSSIFDRDTGMFYSFCYLAASLGMIIFYYVAWFLPYKHNITYLPPPYPSYCAGKRKCMNISIIVYCILSFSTVFTSYLVHWRYKRLVEKNITQDKQTS